MIEDIENPDWKRKYREYIDMNYLALLRKDRNQPMSKIELLTLGVVKFQIEDKELLIVKLPFHQDNPFVFYKEQDGNYFLW